MTRTASKTVTMVALLLASFVINLDTTLVNVALPTLSRQLGATTSQLQWVVDAYNLVFAALLLTAGSLSDRFGRKGMLLAGLVVFGAASFGGAFATTSGGLIAARAVMGLGAAMTFPSTLSLLTGLFTARKERALAIGLWGAVGGLAIALGPIVGGALLQHYRWPSVFSVLGPVGLAIAALAARYVPRGAKRPRYRLDVAGLILSSAFMGVLVYTIIEAPDHGWTSARSIVGYGAGAVLLGGFVLAERMVARPMLDVRLFANRRFSAASASVSVGFFTLFGFIFLITQFFQFVRGYSALTAGVRLLPVAISVAVGSVVGTRLAIKLGTKAVVGAGLLLQGAFYFWVAASVSPSFPYPAIAVQMVIFGLGMGLTSAPATESIMGAIADDAAGVGSAVNDATRLLGGTLGVAVIGSVYASSYRPRIDDVARAIPGTPHSVDESIGASYGVAGRLAARGNESAAALLRHAATSAFDHGVAIGCVVAGAVALLGAVVAILCLPAQPPAAPEPRLRALTPSDADLSGALAG